MSVLVADSREPTPIEEAVQREEAKRLQRERERIQALAVMNAQRRRIYELEKH